MASGDLLCVAQNESGRKRDVTIQCHHFGESPSISVASEYGVDNLAEDAA